MNQNVEYKELDYKTLTLFSWAYWQNPSVRSSLMVLALMTAAGMCVAYMIGEPARLFSKGAEYLTQFVESKNLPAWLPGLLGIMIPTSMILGLVQMAPAVIVWWERKVSAHMQSRLGPMRVGGWHGWAQTIADGIKLLLKEDIVPDKADRWVHFAAPIVVFVPAFMCYAPIPWGENLAAVNLDNGLLYILAVSGLSVIGIVMAGWGSNSKYSMLGGLRAAAQTVSYEVPRVLSVIPVVMWTGTMHLSQIVQAQSGSIAGGIIPRWFIFYPIVGQVAFMIFFISTVAETNRTPFDIPEAESELVAGFHTEYSGMKWAFFFMAEYAYIFLGSALGVVLFLGGGYPFPGLGWLSLPSWVWFFSKTFFLVFWFLAFRWTYPRLRVDRLMDFCWKFLIPVTLINIILAGIIILIRS